MLRIGYFFTLLLIFISSDCVLAVPGNKAPLSARNSGPSLFLDEESLQDWGEYSFTDSYYGGFFYEASSLSSPNSRRNSLDDVFSSACDRRIFNNPTCRFFGALIGLYVLYKVIITYSYHAYILYFSLEGYSKKQNALSKELPSKALAVRRNRKSDGQAHRRNHLFWLVANGIGI